MSEPHAFHVATRASPDRRAMGAVHQRVTLTVWHWCEQYRLIEFLYGDVVQMLLVNSTLLGEELGKLRVVNQHPVCL